METYKEMSNLDELHIEAKTLSNCVGGDESLLGMISELRTLSCMECFSNEERSVNCSKATLTWDNYINDKEILLLIDKLIYDNSCSGSNKTWEESISDDGAQQKALRALVNVIFHIEVTEDRASGVSFGIFEAVGSSLYELTETFKIIFFYPVWLVSKALKYRLPESVV